MYIVFDVWKTKPTFSNILRVRSVVTTLDARMRGERERERANISIRNDARRLGTAHVPGNQIPKQSRMLDSEVLPNHQQFGRLQDQFKIGEPPMSSVIGSN